MKNYYEIFDLVPSFKIDTQALDAQYLRLARKYHPDRNSGYFQEMVRLNQAYRTLNNWETRVEYLFELKNIRLLSQHPEFLEKVWDLRDAGDSTALQSLRNSVKTSLEHEIQNQQDTVKIQKLYSQYRYLKEAGI